MDNLIPIGKMAEINKTTIATLRLYDKIGLLKPAYIDRVTNYRYYTIKQNYKLDMIIYMKELGMSLEEIIEVFKKEDIMIIEDILSRKKEQIYQEIDKLKAQKEAVIRTIDSIEKYRKSPTKGIITLEYIERRYIYSYLCKSNFYLKGLEDFEQQLSKFRSSLINKGVYQVHSYNVGTNITKLDFKKDNYVPHEIFIFVDSHFEYINETKIIDSGMYACIYLDNFDEEIIYAKKLKDYCKQNGYQINGDYICEILTEFNVFNKDEHQMYLKLQVPVKF